ncbi:autotransporter assembly complex protein TamB [Spirabiliibacterium falconis]|uniref:autotransporter assembly complex protein TamB n=1 Tax=Spirabiliibacterium falconis TaxID=572023 RepID=UPI001AACEC1D|nr:translocation/assembly module TamB domain-containing protein [Spirabiliibacterium falconis]MBE2895092.1 translocation/assembly module TamB [Spirabiliibacterium falconis]
MAEQAEKVSTTSEQQPQKTHKHKCGWRKFLWVILCFVVLVVVAFGVLLGTGVGQRNVLKWADSLLDQLHIGSIEGSLSEGLVLKELTYQANGVAVRVGDMRAQWQLGCLLQRKICIDDITVRHADIAVDTSQLPPSEPSPPREMQKIHLPVAVEIKHVQLSEMTTQIDQTQVSLGNFTTALSLNNDSGLTIMPTTIDGVAVHLVARESENQTSEAESREEKTASAVNPMDWDALRTQLQQPLLGKLKTVVLPFAINVQGIQGQDWHYQQQHSTGDDLAIAVAQLRVQLQADESKIALPQLMLKSNLIDLEGQGEITLSGEYPLDVHLQGQTYDLKQGERVLLPATKLTVELIGALAQTTQFTLSTSEGFEAKLAGDIQLSQSKNPFNVTLSAPHFHYPLALHKDESPQFAAEKLNVNVSGDLLNYHIAFDSLLRGQSIPKLHANLAADGELTALNIHALTLDGLQGQSQLQGQLDWTQGVRWQTALSLQHINTAEFTPDWKAVLNGGLKSEGVVNGETWQASVSELDVQGKLNGQPLQLTGRAQSSTERLLNADDLKLLYGNNTLRVNGYLDQHSDLRVDINAPNLAGLLPGLSASMQGNVVLQGDIKKPYALLDLTSSRLDFNDVHLRNLSAKGKVNVDEQIQGGLYLDLASLQFNDIQLKQTKIIADGSEQNHKLNIRTQGEPVSGTFNVYGSFDRAKQVWGGTLAKIQLTSPVGSWKNDQNIKLNVDLAKSEAEVAAHCWLNNQAQICFPSAFKAGKQGDVPFELKHVNLTMLTPFLDDKMQLTGMLNGHGHVAWFDNKPFALDVNINSPAIAFKQKIDYRTFQLDLSNLSLNSTIKDNTLNLKSAVEINHQGTLSSDINIADLPKSRQLSGNVALNALRLGPLVNPLLAKGEQVKGAINSYLQFGGSLQAPLLNGHFNVSDLALKMFTSPVQISDGQLNLAFNGTSSTLQGVLKTPDSQLNLSGDASWKTLEQWQAHLNANANRFKVNIPKMAKLEASPNIDVHATPKLVNVTGTVDVPWARIKIEELPESAVAVSSDMVIVDAKNRATVRNVVPRQETMQFSSDVKVNIGDDVFLDAYGLKANLVGTLDVRQEKNLGLYGQVDIKNGRYNSYGQDLLIRRGQISFSGLASQPFLNIEAIRNPEAMENSKIVAGLKVTGIADQPDVQVFSEPAMSQDEALSYLLTGRGLDNSGDAASGASIGAAMLGLGLSKGGKVVGGIGEAFGISDLSLDTAGIGDSSQVVVSGNITPRLQVKYGVGLFQPIAELTLRYKIIPQLYLQSVSGVNQAVDLLYQFEF